MPVSASDLNRPPPPAAIDAGAQQVVEQIVAPGDRVEHPGDARRAISRDRSRLMPSQPHADDTCWAAASDLRARLGHATRRSTADTDRDRSRGAEDLAGHEVGEVVERFRQLVERRHRRQDHRAGFGAEHHVASAAAGSSASRAAR